MSDDRAILLRDFCGTRSCFVVLRYANCNVRPLASC